MRYQIFFAYCVMFFYSAQLVQQHEATAKNESKVNVCSLAPVRIAIIDTGLDMEHAKLKQITRSPAIKMLAAWNVMTKSSDVQDDSGHGTHITGIILEYLSNYIEQHVSQKECPLFEILPIKFYDKKNKGDQNLKNAIASIEWALKNNVHIINFSAGGSYYSAEEAEAVKKTLKANVLLVTAAGNDKKNLDQPDTKYYPACYGIENTITVGAVNHTVTLEKYSNYSKNIVDVVALGSNIVSWLPNSKVGPMSGTSQATAIVSTVAAIMRQKFSIANTSDLKQKVLSLASCTYDSLKGKGTVKHGFIQSTSWTSKMLNL